MRAIALLAVAAGLFVAPVQAQPASVQTPDEIRPGIPASAGELTAIVVAHVNRGDSLRSKLRYADAETEYRRAAQIARTEGHLPSLTMWRVASASYFAGDLRRAAAVLDQLVNEASQSGELSIQALALFNAAWLNGQAGRYHQAVLRVQRLETLLRSPYIPAAIRDHLKEQLNMPSVLVAKP